MIFGNLKRGVEPPELGFMNKVLKTILKVKSSITWY